jgi:hypothetical protein
LTVCRLSQGSQLRVRRHAVAQPESVGRGSCIQNVGLDADPDADAQAAADIIKALRR